MLQRDKRLKKKGLNEDDDDQTHNEVSSDSASFLTPTHLASHLRWVASDALPTLWQAASWRRLMLSGLPLMSCLFLCNHMLWQALLPRSDYWQLIEDLYNMSKCWLMWLICLLQLMVAEKKGTIRFYDLVTQQAILSLDCGQSPLMSADWCLTNTIKVGAVAGNDWLIWDITRSRWGQYMCVCCTVMYWCRLVCKPCARGCSYPQEKRPAHIDKARLFRWGNRFVSLYGLKVITLNCRYYVRAVLRMWWHSNGCYSPPQVVSCQWKPLRHHWMSRKNQ